MAKGKGRNRTRQRLSLSVRLSLLVLFAALVPLAAVLGINDYFARGTLVHQGQQALTTDAQAKVNLVDRYIFERFSDGVALASLPTAPAFLLCAAATQMPAQQAAIINEQANCLSPELGFDFYKGSNQRALCVGLVRDPNYTQWAIFTARGDALLAYQPTGDPKTPCKPTQDVQAIPKQDLAQAQQGQPFAGDVHFDPKGKFAYINLYTPIRAPGPTPTVLGFLQSRLRLDYIWNVVNGEDGANGTGSYAFITDGSGIRIASAKASELFTSIQPLDSATSSAIASSKRFGSDNPITTLSLPANFQHVQEQVHIANPAQAVDPTAPAQITLPWTYYVLSPNTTIEAVANTQLRISLLSAAVVALLAVLIGLFIGRRLTVPVRASVVDLRGAAISLKQLATRQQSSASEQQWVVDACRTGLESVRYLSDAMNQAAHRVIDASNWFSEYWDRLTEEQARRTVQHLLELAHYIDEAARRQQTSSERLGKAISVTMQVSDQLVAGASAATQSSGQLEQVVDDLQRLVGGRAPRSAESEEDLDSDDLAFEGEMPVLAGMERGQSPHLGRLETPSQGYGSRQLMPPTRSDAWQDARSPQLPPSIWGSTQHSSDGEGLGRGYGQHTSGGQHSNGVPANSGWPDWSGR